MAKKWLIASQERITTIINAVNVARGYSRNAWRARRQGGDHHVAETYSEKVTNPNDLTQFALRLSNEPDVLRILTPGERDEVLDRLPDSWKQDPNLLPFIYTLPVSWIRHPGFDDFIHSLPKEWIWDPSLMPQEWLLDSDNLPSEVVVLAATGGSGD